MAFIWNAIKSAAITTEETVVGVAEGVYDTIVGAEPRDIVEHDDPNHPSSTSRDPSHGILSQEDKVAGAVHTFLSATGGKAVALAEHAIDDVETFAASGFHKAEEGAEATAKFVNDNVLHPLLDPVGKAYKGFWGALSDLFGDVSTLGGIVTYVVPALAIYLITTSSGQQFTLAATRRQ